MFGLLHGICEKEYLKPDEEILRKIVKDAEGIPRNAVNKLQESYLAGKLEKKEIRILEGNNNVIVIAAHEPTEDDDNVNFIAEQLNKEQGCYCVINEKYKRKDIDPNNITEVIENGIEAEFLIPIKEIKDQIRANGLQPIIILIHGIKDKNIHKAAGPNAQILIGYGQGEDGNAKQLNRDSIANPDLESLQKALDSVGLCSAEAPPESRYCGRDEDNLNQLFNLDKHKDYYDHSVRSVQLEIGFAGLRGNEDEAIETGRRLALALKRMFEEKIEVAETLTDEPKDAVCEKPTDAKPAHESDNVKGMDDNPQIAGDRPSQFEMSKLADLKTAPAQS